MILPTLLPWERGSERGVLEHAIRGPMGHEAAAAERKDGGGGGGGGGGRGIERRGGFQPWAR